MNSGRGVERCELSYTVGGCVSCCSHHGQQYGGSLKKLKIKLPSDQIRSVAQSCPTLCDPMNRSTPGFPVHPNSRSSFRLTSIKSVMPSSHLILCRPLLLLPPIPPSIRVFSNESTLHMRWPKYWISASASFLPRKSQG